MKITIEADAKEIAALVVELQERREFPDQILIGWDAKKAMESALEAIRGKPEADGD